MELGKQIQKHRKERKLSQEALAADIFVSTQTISNWETSRTYPDVHNLIALSSYFDISIDKLIKGDLEMMRDLGIGKKLEFYSIIYTVALLIGAILLGPVFKYADNWFGYSILIFLAVVGIIYSTKAEKIKKKYNVHTMKQIEEFVETGRIIEHAEQKRNKFNLLLIVLVFTVIVTTVAIISLKLFN